MVHSTVIMSIAVKGVRGGTADQALAVGVVVAGG